MKAAYDDPDIMFRVKMPSSSYSNNQGNYYVVKSYYINYITKNSYNRVQKSESRYPYVAFVLNTIPCLLCKRSYQLNGLSENLSLIK